MEPGKEKIHQVKHISSKAYKIEVIEISHKTRLGKVLNQSSLRLTYVGSDDPIDL